jgi:hypothetical protein
MEIPRYWSHLRREVWLVAVYLRSNRGSIDYFAAPYFYFMLAIVEQNIYKLICQQPIGDLAMNFTHVVFESVFPNFEVSIELSQIEKFWEMNRNQHLSFRVCKAFQNNDPTQWSWAKHWYKAQSMDIAQIGVGAYGDHTIWQAA